MTWTQPMVPRWMLMFKWTLRLLEAAAWAGNMLGTYPVAVLALSVGVVVPATVVFIASMLLLGTSYSACADVCDPYGYKRLDGECYCDHSLVLPDPLVPEEEG